MEKFDIVGLGYAAVDYFGIVPYYPPLDCKMEMIRFSKQGGGPVATAMAAASRLGAKVRYIGKTGDDEFGEFILSQLWKDGVDTSRVVIQHGAQSPFSFIIVDRDTGKRTIVWSRSDVEQLRPEEVYREDIVMARVLHVDGHEMDACIAASAWANEAGVTVLFDAGSVRPGVQSLIQNVDVLIASEGFARDFTGHTDPLVAARELLKGRTQTAVVTAGEHGCAGVTSRMEFQLPAFHVDVVDTTGAGDVFHGAYSVGLLKEWDARKIALFAGAAAAIKCTKLGGRDGIPDYKQVAEFLAERGIDLGRS